MDRSPLSTLPSKSVTFTSANHYAVLGEENTATSERARYRNTIAPGLDRTSPKHHSTRKGSPDGVMHESRRSNNPAAVSPESPPSDHGALRERSLVPVKQPERTEPRSGPQDGTSHLQAAETSTCPTETSEQSADTIASKERMPERVKLLTEQPNAGRPSDHAGSHTSLGSSVGAVREATEGIVEQRSTSRELFPRRGASFETNSTRVGGGDQAHGSCSERPVNDPAYRPSSSADLV